MKKLAESIILIFFSKNLPLIFKWTGIVFCFYFVSRAVEALAGKNTNSMIIFKLMEYVDDSEVTDVFIFTTIISIAWAFSERAHRHRKVRACYTRVRELEKRLDPDRTSSGLTPEGKTNPEDLT